MLYGNPTPYDKFLPADARQQIMQDRLMGAGQALLQAAGDGQNTAAGLAQGLGAFNAAGAASRQRMLQERQMARQLEEEDRKDRINQVIRDTLASPEMKKEIERRNINQQFLGLLAQLNPEKALSPLLDPEFGQPRILTPGAMMVNPDGGIVRSNPLPDRSQERVDEYGFANTQGGQTARIFFDQMLDAEMAKNQGQMPSKQTINKLRVEAVTKAAERFRMVTDLAGNPTGQFSNVRGMGSNLMSEMENPFQQPQQQIPNNKDLNYFKNKYPELE